MSLLRERIEAAVEMAERYGGHDGAHHKQWVIDQMLKALLGDRYEGWLERMNADPDYEKWDQGIAP